MSAAITPRRTQLGNSSGGARTDESLTAATGSLVAALKEQARHISELAAAEARLAALSTIAMLAFGVLAAAAAMMTWALLVLLAADGLMRLGMAWQLAVAILAALHLLAAYGLWRGAVGMSANLTWPRLRSVLFADVAPPRR